MHVRSRWRRPTCQTLALAMILLGLTVAATPQAHGTVKPVTPTRVVDTRLNQGAPGPVPLNTGRTVDLGSTAGLSAVPQGALLNLTVTEPQASGWLSAYPAGVARPVVSNLHFTAGMMVPNLSLATLNSGSAVLYNGSPGSVQIVADVLAYVLS